LAGLKACATKRLLAGLKACATKRPSSGTPKNRFYKPNAMIVGPAAIAMYCLLSNM